MPRLPSRLLIAALALIALIFLSPALSTALPQRAAVPSAADRPEAAPGLFSKAWDFLSAIWTTSSVPEPNGTDDAPGREANEAGSGDNGSGLEPDGRP